MTNVLDRLKTAERTAAEKFTGGVAVVSRQIIVDAIDEIERLRTERDELAEAIEELGNRLFGSEDGQKIKWREAKADWWQRCRRAVEAAEAARAEVVELTCERAEG